MREILLAFWFVWQAATAPFYPDPAVEVARARSFLEAHLRVGHQLGPDVLYILRAEGFKILPLSPNAERQIRSEQPWSDLPATRIYICSKAIPGRPAISLTNVEAMYAVNDEKQVLVSFVRVNRTFL